MMPLFKVTNDGKGNMKFKRMSLWDKFNLWRATERKKYIMNLMIDNLYMTYKVHETIWTKKPLSPLQRFWYKLKIKILFPRLK